MEKTTINERMQMLLDGLGMNKNSFAVKIGATPQAIGNIVRNLSKPGFELIEKILDTFPSVSEKWLVRGVGPMFITDEPNEGAISKSLDDYLQKYLTRLEESFKVALDEKTKTIEDKNSTIKSLLISIDVLSRASQLPGKQLVNEKMSAVMRVSHSVFDRSVNSLVNTGS